MAITTLAIVYNATTGRITHSGLTNNALPDVMKKVLAKHGLDFYTGGPLAGRILDTSAFSAVKRAQIKTDFDRRFGHPLNPYSTKVDSTATVNEGAAYAAGDLTLTSSDGAQTAQYDYIQIDDEVLYITAVAGNNLTVVRGQDGTIDAAHDDLTAIYIVPTYVVTFAAA